jgi:hypothetical protein
MASHVCSYTTLACNKGLKVKSEQLLFFLLESNRGRQKVPPLPCMYCGHDGSHSDLHKVSLMEKENEAEACRSTRNSTLIGRRNTHRAALDRFGTLLSLIFLKDEDFLHNSIQQCVRQDVIGGADKVIT